MVQLHHIEEIESTLKEIICTMEIAQRAWLNYGALDHAREQLRYNLLNWFEPFKPLNISGSPLTCFKAAFLGTSSMPLPLKPKPTYTSWWSTTLQTCCRSRPHIYTTVRTSSWYYTYQWLLLTPSSSFFSYTCSCCSSRTVTSWCPIQGILALSSGNKHLSIELLAVNLLGCHRISSVYLCKRHSILKKELNSTCLGSLYVQDFRGPMTSCKMDILPQAMTVLQLQDNWYLVHSPHQFISYVSCLNTSNSGVFIRPHVNCIFVSPSCCLQLLEHVLISDFAICLDAVINHYKWDLDHIAFSTEDQSCSAKWMAILSDENIGKPTLPSVLQSLVVECRSSIWQYVFTLLGLLMLVLLAVLAGYIIFTQHIITLKQRIFLLLGNVLPESVLHMLQCRLASQHLPPKWNCSPVVPWHLTK